MSELYFSDQHEWVRIEDDGTATVGISDYAQKQLGDVVYVELPAVGRAVKQFAEAAVVESVKAASDVYAPVSGDVIAVNEALATDPALVNRDPGGAGWFMRIRIKDKTELKRLMTPTAYMAFIAEQG